MAYENEKPDLIAVWGTYEGHALRELVSPAAAAACWQVTDIEPTDPIEQALFDARDALRDDYAAIMIAARPNVRDAAVLLAAMQHVLAVDHGALFILADEPEALWQLLSMGDTEDILGVMARMAETRIHVWQHFDEAALSATLVRLRKRARP
jgi:hypothetical protein